MGTSKTCGKCGEIEAVSAFYRPRRTKDGLNQRTYHGKHPEMKRLYVKRPRALRKGAPGHHTLAEWRQLREAYGHKCLCCGVSGVPLT